MEEFYLPNEILEMIILNLDNINEIVKLREVNNNFKNVIDNNLIYLPAFDESLTGYESDEEEEEMNNNALIKINDIIQDTSGSAKILVVKTYFTLRNFSDMIEKFHNLTYIDVEASNIDSLPAYLPNLKFLDCNNCPGLTTLGNYPNLEYLDCSKCRYINSPRAFDYYNLETKVELTNYPKLFFANCGETYIHLEQDDLHFCPNLIFLNLGHNLNSAIFNLYPKWLFTSDKISVYIGEGNKNRFSLNPVFSKICGKIFKDELNINLEYNEGMRNVFLTINEYLNLKLVIKYNSEFRKNIDLYEDFMSNLN